MSSRIAKFAMQGRWQAAVAITFLSFAALLLWPLSYFSSGVIVLATLRSGPKEGVKVVVIATLMFTLLTEILLGQSYISGAFLLLVWLPVLAATLVLGYTRSLSTSVLSTCILGIFMVLGTHSVFNDPAIWWYQLLMTVIEVLVQQPGWRLDQMQTQELLVSTSGMMTGWIFAVLSINMILGLLIGRAWLATLFCSSNISTQFRQLNLGKQAASVAIVFMLIAISPLHGDWTLVIDCLPVMLTAFTLQGLAVIHAMAWQKQRHKFWLIGTYVLLVLLMHQMMVLLAVIGILEQWINFRRYSVE